MKSPSQQLLLSSFLVVAGATAFAAPQTTSSAPAQEDPALVTREMEIVGHYRLIAVTGEIFPEPLAGGAEVAGSGGAPLSRNLEKAMTGTFWISFLTRMDEQQGYGWQIMFADEPGEPQFQFFNGKSENNRWRIQSPKTGRTKPADGIFESRQGMLPTDPALVILRVQNAGSGNADGSILAYINPTDLRDPEISALGSVKISGLQLNAIKSFVFDKKTTTTGYIDELRFGETLEDVLPTE